MIGDGTSYLYGIGFLTSPISSLFSVFIFSVFVPSVFVPSVFIFSVFIFSVFIPPTLISLTYPHIFLKALSYAGGYSCAILFGLFPPVMAWVGRYVKKYPKETRILPG